MNKNLINSLFIVLAMLPFLGFAQEQVKDPKAKAILEELSKKNKAYRSIKADFSYILENKAEDIHEVQKGKLTLKGEKYKLEIAGQEIISDGNTLWTYISDADELQINNVPDAQEAEASGMITPAGIFTIYEKGFKYKFDKEFTENGVKLQVIDLFPDNPGDKPYHTVKIIVDAAKVQFKEIIVMGKDGNTYTYRLNSFTPDTDIPDSFFTFDESKVDEVIDLR